MRDLTCVYYTSNHEKPAFEAKIQRTLLDNMGDIPLISVSQQPIALGENICVGEVGVSSQNAWRQLQIGAQAACTRFVCTAESDSLYPSEYFTFTPPRDDTFYLAQPLWVLFAQRGHGKCYYQKPRASESAMMVNRELLVKRLGEILDKHGQWGTLDADGVQLAYPLERRYVKGDYYTLDVPIITIKTDENMHRKTPHNTLSKTRDLDGWGAASDLLARYMAP